MIYKFEFDAARINLIAAGLEKLPFFQVNALLNELKASVIKQEYDARPKEPKPEMPAFQEDEAA